MPPPHSLATEDGGGGTEDVPSLYAQYVARTEQLSREPKEGYKEYTKRLRPEFDKWSRKRQIWEIKQLGTAIESTDDAIRLYIRDDDQYPKGKAMLPLPTIAPASLKTADLLHHKSHVELKIKALHKQVRELRREARMQLRDRRRRLHKDDSARHMVSGIDRITRIYDTHMALRKHCQLLLTIDSQIKTRLRMHRNDTRPIYVDPTA